MGDGVVGGNVVGGLVTDTVVGNVVIVGDTVGGLVASAPVGDVFGLIVWLSVVAAAAAATEV